MECEIKNKAKEIISNITLNSERLSNFPVRLGTRQKCSLSPVLLNIVLEFLVTIIIHLKKKHLYVKK